MLKITIEKQKSWGRENLDSKLSLKGENFVVEGFTITDLPFSTILQAYWFLASFFANLFIDLLGTKKVRDYWQDTDSYYFYKNIMGNKPKKEFLKTFWKLHQRLLEHEDTFEALKYTPAPIVSVAANGCFKKTLLNKIDRVLAEKPTGVFIVSGGGVIQNYLKRYLGFLRSWPVSSSNLFRYARLKVDKINKSENTSIKIFAAANPNLKTETLERLIIKNKNFTEIDTLLTQPPFNWSRFEKYIEQISSNQHTKNISIRVGVPIFTSAWNVRFWMMLLNINWKNREDNSEAYELVRLFENKYNNDKSEKRGEFKEFSKNWTISFIQKIQKLQGKYKQIDGIHLMPMGNYIPVEDIISAISAKNSSPACIKYETIKYKNHFRVLDSDVSVNKVFLDPEFVPQSKSKIWDLNQMFWENVDDFMLAIGRNYHKSVGGSADSNLNLAKYSAKKFYEQHKKTDKEINYLEMGAAGTEWSKMFLDEINSLGGLPNFNYIFTDYSRKPLLLARQILGDKYGNTNIKYVYLGDGKVKDFFEMYKVTISQIHATNIYDNFPMDRILYQDAKIYEVLVKAFINNSNKDVFNEFFKTYSEGNLQTEFYLNWQKLWNELKFEEQYIEIGSKNDKEKFDFYTKLNPQNLHLEMNVGPEVTKNIMRNFSLLVPGGALEIIDIIATNIEKYKEFLGPVKYDGSIANYMNLPEILEYLKEKNINFNYHIDSLEKFGGRRNQSILEITKK